MKRLPVLVAGALSLGAAAAPTGGDEAMQRLAREHGCSTCHRIWPSPGNNTVVPYAPSWHEVASRYRGQPGAEEALTRIVIAGSDPGKRHWRNQAAFASMPANEVEASPEEARALVRWILSLR